MDGGYLYRLRDILPVLCGFAVARFGKVCVRRLLRYRPHLFHLCLFLSPVRLRVRQGLEVYGQVRGYLPVPLYRSVCRPNCHVRLSSGLYGTFTSL